MFLRKHYFPKFARIWGNSETGKTEHGFLLLLLNH